jgi:hypothetical protein
MEHNLSGGEKIMYLASLKVELSKECKTKSLPTVPDISVNIYCTPM